MSTDSVVYFKNKDTGKYHFHSYEKWDGYPSSKGVQVMEQFPDHDENVALGRALRKAFTTPELQGADYAYIYDPNWNGKGAWVVTADWSWRPEGTQVSVADYLAKDEAEEEAERNAYTAHLQPVTPMEFTGAGKIKTLDPYGCTLMALGDKYVYICKASCGCQPCHCDLIQYNNVRMLPFLFKDVAEACKFIGIHEPSKRNGCLAVAYDKIEHRKRFAAFNRKVKKHGCLVNVYGEANGSSGTFETPNKKRKPYVNFTYVPAGAKAKSKGVNK